MSQTAKTDRRGMGRPPKISRREVLDAAREVGDDVTMQAVADRLQVSRAALYHYVSGTDELRRLVARSTVGPLEMPDPEPTEWRSWVLEFARTLRRWRIRHREEGPYLYFSAEVLSDRSFLDIGQRGIAMLIAAGFTEKEAAGALQFVTGVVWINTHDEMMAMDTVDGRHPQLREIDRDTEDDSTRIPDGFDEAQRLIEQGGVFGDPDSRFEREVRWAVQGLERDLDKKDQT